MPPVVSSSAGSPTCAPAALRLRLGRWLQVGRGEADTIPEMRSLGEDRTSAVRRAARPIVAAAACLALAGAACAGGGAEPATGPGTDATSTVSGGSPIPGAGAAVGTFRACHKHRDGSLVLILLFENHDRALVNGFEGALGFDVQAAVPATWTTGDAVQVDPGYNEHVRQITVPAEEPAPSEVTLTVTTTAAVDATNVLATNDVTIPVPASACSSA